MRRTPRHGHRAKHFASEGAVPHLCKYCMFWKRWKSHLDLHYPGQGEWRRCIEPTPLHDKSNDNLAMPFTVSSSGAACTQFRARQKFYSPLGAPAPLSKRDFQQLAQMDSDFRAATGR